MRFLGHPECVHQHCKERPKHQRIHDLGLVLLAIWVAAGIDRPWGMFGRNCRRWCQRSQLLLHPTSTGGATDLWCPSFSGEISKSSFLLSHSFFAWTVIRFWRTIGKLFWWDAAKKERQEGGGWGKKVTQWKNVQLFSKVPIFQLNSTVLQEGGGGRAEQSCCWRSCGWGDFFCHPCLFFANHCLFVFLPSSPSPSSHVTHIDTYCCDNVVTFLLFILNCWHLYDNIVKNDDQATRPWL